jgi:hypothetical protein
MIVTKVITHWEADEALSVIEFLDELKALLKYPSNTTSALFVFVAFQNPLACVLQ